MPSPKWKLIVDLGVSAHDEDDNSDQYSRIATELLNNLSTVMPRDQRSPLAEYLPGFSSIRLLLTTTTHSDREKALLRSVIDCYKTYKAAGATEHDAIWMTARDCMIPSKHMQLSQLKPSQEVKYGGHLAPQAVANFNPGDGLNGQAVKANYLPVDVSQRSLLGFESLGNDFGISNGQMYDISPVLQSRDCVNDQVDALAGFAPLTYDGSQLGASQLSAFLQSDPRMRFPGIQ